MDTTVRPALRSDWSRLRPLLQRMGSFVDDDTASERFEAITASDDHILAVATESGDLVGYAWAHDHGPHLRSAQRLVRLNDLYVDPASRRKGHGRALFTTVERWARDRGVRWMQWQASRDALEFYQQLGLKGDPCPDPLIPSSKSTSREGSGNSPRAARATFTCGDLRPLPSRGSRRPSY